MTNEEKQLLLKDLCERLPYGVKCNTEDGNGILISIECSYGEDLAYVDFGYEEAEEYDLNEDDMVKPYLRPMSSMTEEERMEFTKLFDKWHNDELFDYIEEVAEFSIWKHKGISPVVFDWLNAHHFDYRGLIEKGFAIEAPKGMYKTE